MNISLRGRMALLFLAFFLLVCVSTVATFWIADTQAKDALVINLAGRQRMLIQQITRDVLEIERGRNRSSNLRASVRTFDQTLHALFSGGAAPYLVNRMVDVPAARNADVVNQLQQVRHTWGEFREQLNMIAVAEPGSPDFDAAMGFVERLSPRLLQQADQVVRAYETASTQKVDRLRWVQIAFFVSALVLLVAGFLITHRSVIEPLRRLGSVAERIGTGDLDTPVGVTGPREIELLAHRFDTMRDQLQTSQAELTAWAEELEARVAQRTQELAALYDVSREISSQLDIDHVLRSVTDKARKLLGGEVAFLCLLDDAGQGLALQAISGPEKALRRRWAPAQDQPAARVLDSQEAVRCGVADCAGACALVAAPFRTSHLAAPLQVKGRVIGALCVGSPAANAFPDDVGGTPPTNLLTKLANSAAIALENARLYERAERVAILEERERIAAEMHDGLAQTLSYLHLQVDQVAERITANADEKALASLERVRERLARAADDVRANIAGLSTSPPPPQTLSELLTDIVYEAADGQSVDLSLVASDLEDLKVTSDVAEPIRRIVQEALLNAYRHAEASQIQVRLEQADGEAVITVQDDGCGLEVDKVLAGSRHHFGLRTMRARADRMGGRLMVESTPGHGTRVTLRWLLG